MHRIRTLSAWLLLAALCATIAPKEWLHVCAHGETGSVADPQGSTFKAACAACDLCLLLAVDLPHSPQSKPMIIGTDLHGPAIVGTSLGFTPLAADRGPPAFI